MFGKRPSPEVIDRMVLAVRAELRRQGDTAADRIQNPFFTDGQTGRNMGKDELLALVYLGRIDLEPTADEQIRPVAYLNRVLEQVRAAKQNFAHHEDDPEGYGAGTFCEVMRALERQLNDVAE